MQEAEARRQLRLAEGLGKAVGAAEERINAHARKLRGAERKAQDAAAEARAAAEQARKVWRGRNH